jgi:hypothetical protein
MDDDLGRFIIFFDREEPLNIFFFFLTALA